MLEYRCAEKEPRGRLRWSECVCECVCVCVCVCRKLGELEVQGISRLLEGGGEASLEGKESLLDALVSSQKHLADTHM